MCPLSSIWPLLRPLPVWIPVVLNLQSQVNLSLWPTTSPFIQMNNVGRLQGAVWLLAPLLTEHWQQLQVKIITHPGPMLPPIFWEILLCNFNMACSWKRKRSSGYFPHDVHAKLWQIHTKRFMVKVKPQTSSFCPFFFHSHVKPSVCRNFCVRLASVAQCLLLAPPKNVMTLMTGLISWACTDSVVVERSPELWLHCGCVCSWRWMMILKLLKRVPPVLPVLAHCSPDI